MLYGVASVVHEDQGLVWLERELTTMAEPRPRGRRRA